MECRRRVTLVMVCDGFTSPPPTVPPFRAGERDAVNDPESTRWGRERDRHSIQRFLRPRDSKFARSGGQAGLTLRLPAEQKDEAVAADGWPQQQVCAVRAVGSGAEDLQSTLHFISFHFALLS